MALRHNYDPWEQSPLALVQSYKGDEEPGLPDVSAVVDGGGVLTPSSTWMWALSWWGYWLRPPCSSYFKYTTRRHILTQMITLTLPLNSSFLFLYLHFLDSISTQSYLKESFINPHTLSEYGPVNPLGIIPVFRVYVLPKKAWGLIFLACSLETVTLSSWTLLGGFNNDPVTEFLAHSR